jgi:hypothetical protein
MKEISTVQTLRNEIFKEQKLTIGLRKCFGPTSVQLKRL